MGRSSFGAPLAVHVHAVLFFGWSFFYLLQTGLAVGGNRTWHRRLGWLAIGWVPALVAMGFYITITSIRHGRAPFFFLPGQFLILDPLSVLTFAGLTGTAIAMRRKTQWHRRLLYCGMTELLGPGFGRLLPMPLMIPWADWGVFAAIMLFPLAGVIRDLRATGRVHPAWWVGIGVLTAAQLAIMPMARSPMGLALYEAVVAGTPAAAQAPLTYPPPPGGPPR